MLGVEDLDFYYYRRKATKGGKGRKWIRTNHGIVSLWRAHAYMAQYCQNELPQIDDVRRHCDELDIKFIELRTSTVDEPWAVLARRTIGEIVSTLQPKLDESLVDAHSQIAL